MAALYDNDPGRTAQWPRILGWSFAGALLLLPAVAMQFTREVTWTASDFVVFGAMLLVIGGAFEFLARKGAFAYRLAAGLALLGVFLLVWINLAVGIIGSEQNDANMMFAAVLAVLTGGAIVAQFRAAGMARALVATAAVQAIVGAIALIGRLGVGDPSWPYDVIGLTGLFTALWLVAALLFGRAARVG